LRLEVLFAILVLLSAQPPSASSNNVDPANANDLPQWERLLHGNEWTRLYRMGNRLWDLRVQGLYTKAIDLADSIFVIRTETQGPDHWQTLHSERVLEYVRFASTLSADLQSQLAYADSVDSVGFPWTQGKVDHERAAFRIKRRILGEDHYLTLKTKGALGNSLWLFGRFIEADEMLFQVLDDYKRTGLDETFLAARFRTNLVLLLREQGQTAEAERFAREGVELMRRLYGDDHWQTYYSLAMLGLVLIDQGRLAEAEPLFLGEVESFRKSLGDRHPFTHFAIQDYYQLLYYQGRFAEAEALLGESIDVYIKYHGEDELYTYYYYYYLAQVIAAQDRLEEAESLYRKAIAGIISHMGEANQKTPRTRSGLADVLIRQGKYSEADSLLNLTIKGYELLSMQNAQEAMVTVTRLGKLREMEMRLADAEELYRIVIDRATEVFGHDHPVIVNNLTALGFIKATEGKIIEAGEIWEDAAHRFETVRVRASYGGLQRIHYAADQSPLNPLAVSIAQNDKPIDAWNWYEANLARGLFDALSASRFRPLSGEEKRQEIELAEQLIHVDEKIGAFTANLDSLKNRRALRRLRLTQQKLHADLAEFEAEISEMYGVTSGESFDLSRILDQLPLDAAIVGWIDVEHPFRKESFEGHWTCILRSGMDPIWVELLGSGEDGSWTEIDRGLAHKVRKQLSQETVGKEHADLLLMLRQLYLQRFMPLESQLTGVTLLIILPAGQMAGIPLETLTDKYTISYSPSATMFAWLREESEREKDQLTQAYGELLALGDPDFGAYAPKDIPHTNSPTRGIESVEAEDGFDVIFKRTRNESYIPIPGTRMEVQAIEELFSLQAGESSTTILLGSEASERSLHNLAESGELSSYKRIHFATHARMDDKIAMRSALILSQEDNDYSVDQLLNSEHVYDGKLTADQIVRTWKLNADLVTLSGCETALGKEAGGEGYLGFSQALFIAGAKSLVLSLWNVEDTPTMLLMRRFYENLLGQFDESRQIANKTHNPGEPLPKAEALHEAKQWLRKLTWNELVEMEDNFGEKVYRGSSDEPIMISSDSGDRPFEHPRHWAAFILMGDPD